MRRVKRLGRAVLQWLFPCTVSLDLRIARMIRKAERSGGLWCAGQLTSEEMGALRRASDSYVETPLIGCYYGPEDMHGIPVWSISAWSRV